VDNARYAGQNRWVAQKSASQGFGPASHVTLAVLAVSDFFANDIHLPIQPSKKIVNKLKPYKKRKLGYHQ
jgi:hypothetical protein